MADTEEQTESSQEQDDGAAEMDVTDVPVTEADGALQIPTDRPAKEFFHSVFVNHEITQLKSPAGRSIKKYVATCPVCHRTVSSTDSFYGFRAHYQSKHPDNVEPAEHEGSPVKRFRDPDEMPSSEPVPMAVPDYPEVSTLPFEASGKEFFQRLFIKHTCARETRKSDNRAGTRYSAQCKACGRTMGGLDGFFKFREHYRLRHMGDKEHVGQGADGQGSVVLKSPKKDPTERPAREYFDTFYVDQSAEKEAEIGKRSAVKYTGDCKLCGKRIGGTDSFYGFRAHIKHKHKDIQVQSFEDLQEFISMPSMAGMEMRLANTPTMAEAAATSEDVTMVKPILGADETMQVSAKAVHDQQYSNHRTVLAEQTKAGQKERKKFVADCKACGKTITGNSSYYNFRAHLSICGKEMVDMIIVSTSEVEKKGRGRNSSSPNGPSTSSKSDDRDQMKLNRNVALCAADVLIPLATLTSSSFDRLVKDIDSHLAWPTCQALASKHLPELRSYIRQEIVAELRDAPLVGLTVTICQQRGFICLMVHYVNSKGKLRSPFLSYRRILSSSNASVLLNSVVGVLKEYNLVERVAYVDLVDNFGVNGAIVEGEDEDGLDRDGLRRRWKTMMDELKEGLLTYLKVSPCRVQMRQVVRILESLLESAVRGNAALSALLTKIGNSAAIIKKAASLFKGTSAWGALYQKAKMAAEYMRESTAAARGKAASKLTDEEQEMLLELLKVAEAFDELFIKLRQHDSPTVCDLIPFVYGIHKWLSEFKEDTEILRDFTDLLVQELDARFEGVDDEEQYIMAAFLDPKYKLLWCRGSSATDKDEQVKSIVLSRLLQAEAEPREDTDKEAIKEPPTKRSALLNFLGDSSTKGGPSAKRKLQAELSAAEEIEAYLEDTTTDEDPLTYWAKNDERLPKLATLSRAVLYIPSGTAKTALFRETLFADRPLHLFTNQLELMLFCHLNPEFSRDYSSSKRKLPY
ncbi:hypothetical protein RvY_17553 [Ramazzottius varieornatus]|uniref:HAT C-terminal dimerisation domain-containing protein n=1 Tax=Ramazzottius varieornatus TaxID=947166 RepID=A0A1D1W3A8_RAMVA|nr:hypothetical protein RvY_17553 [Ramazzottius varieornatus]